MSRTLSISQFFEEQLRAPFRNIRWSWGSVDERKRRVFLRLWADDQVKGIPKIRVLEKLLGSDSRPGLSERKHHIDLIRAGGYSAFGILCTRDGPGCPIRDYNSEAILRLGTLVEDSEFVYATVMGAVAVSDIDTLPRV